MNNNKLILPISIIIGAVILGSFYYITQINKKGSALTDLEKRKEILTMKEICRKAGEKANSTRKDNEWKSTTRVSPEYTYNSELNTCLYFVEYKFGLKPPYGSAIAIIKDALTNEKLISLHKRIGEEKGEIISCDECDGEDDFYEKKEKLFNE